MGFKVIFTPESLEGLREVVTFIAQDNPERAGLTTYARGYFRP